MKDKDMNQVKPITWDNVRAPTLQELLEIINQVPSKIRRRSRFTCSYDIMDLLTLMRDVHGNYLVTPDRTGRQFTLMGFPIEAFSDVRGLVFGPNTQTTLG